MAPPSRHSLPERAAKCVGKVLKTLIGLVSVVLVGAPWNCIALYVGSGAPEARFIAGVLPANNYSLTRPFVFPAHLLA